MVIAAALTRTKLLRSIIAIACDNTCTRLTSQSITSEVMRTEECGDRMHAPMEVGISRLGPLLREWRQLRHMSQMELALNTGMSTRHLSFIETGRAYPSEGTVEVLIGALGVPPHEASMFRHLATLGARPPKRAEAPLQQETWDALALLLSGQDPEAAIAFDEACDIIMVNKAYAHFIGRQFGREIGEVVPFVPIAHGRLNILRLILSPDRYRRIITNWEEVARAVLRRLRQTLLINTCGTELHTLLGDLLRYPDVGRLWEEINPEVAPQLVVRVQMQLGERRVSSTSTIATLGGPGDLNLSGICIETFHGIGE